MGLVNDVVSQYVCHLVPVCYVSLQYLVLYLECQFTLIGISHSPVEFDMSSDFELGKGSLQS